MLIKRFFAFEPGAENLIDLNVKSGKKYNFYANPPKVFEFVAEANGLMLPKKFFS